MNLESDGAVATSAARFCRLGQLHPMGFASLVAPQSVALLLKFSPARFGGPDWLTVGSHASFLQVTRVEQIKPNRIFLLSPAYAGGERARMILSERAQFDLARRLRSRERATLGEVFAFLSGLYFRGKLAYANTFEIGRAHV